MVGEKWNLSAVLRARFEKTRSATAARPYIPSGTPRYLYALYRVAGCERGEARAEVAGVTGDGVSERTARYWEKDLRSAVGAYLGRTVTYEFAARFALDEGLRRSLAGTGNA